jgi:molybdopterin-containing oxidoreductase family iron-sulfur binding subunit
MKRQWIHPQQPETGKRYWRSTAELESRAEFLDRLGVEFPAGDSLTTEEAENSRRHFLKLMGASAGLMGLAACRRPLAHILPYTQHVEWVIPGKPLLYASVMPSPQGAVPLVVTTHEGRPTHLAGNPLHPLGGGLSSFAQASILDLYDPERSQQPLAAGKPVSWAQAQETLTALMDAAKKNQGGSVGILIDEQPSPTQGRLLAELNRSLPSSRLFTYQAIGSGGQRRGESAAFGIGNRGFLRLSKAKRILSLDCDFLGLDPVAGEPIKAFTAQRAQDKPQADMNRLYCLENRYTLTGGMADHRKPLPSSLIPAAAALVAEQLGISAGSALAAEAPASLKEWLAPAVRDLIDHKGNAVVLLGSRHSAQAHALVCAINHALGALGNCLEVLAADPAPVAGSAADLQQALGSGQIQTLICLGSANPLHDAPAALASALSQPSVKLVHLGLLPNATARSAALHLPAAHYLEAWDDVRAADGTYSVVQPMIQPLYSGISANELLLALIGRKKLGAPADAAQDPAYQAVRDTFATVAGSLDEVRWNHTLRDGFLKDSAWKTGSTSLQANWTDALKGAPALKAPTNKAMEVVLVPDSGAYDGRYINNAWLQETPDPITKQAWDNAAWVGSVTFRALGLKNGQMIKVTTGDRSLTLPALEAPGHVQNSITIPLGYGQQQLGFVGSDSDGKGRGFNGYALRADAEQYVIAGAKVEVLSESYALAITQDQATMEGRAMIREGTLETFNRQPDFAVKTGMDSHIPQNISFYKGQVGRKSAENPDGFDYEKKHQWGMAIDLSKCLGCTACVVACQSENNIPVVGKDQVIKGRLMQWIRMDRYFATHQWGEQKAKSDDVNIDPTAEQLENAEMVNQPVACQQCESAPCETVCPVNATVHTDDGLNAMAYNRCIGTRYCANNCPYTARRFNWFDYNKRPLDELYWGPLSTPEKTGVRESLQLQKNPNVTVRMRGVIEKCTYCVQRLEGAKIKQKQSQRDSKNFRVPTDSVKTACQEACPAEAIAFGDLADEHSNINKVKASPRNYELLKYIGTRPRTSYLARLRNPNKEMPGAEAIAAWSAHQI